MPEVPPPLVIVRIECSAIGEPSEFDGQYLVEYDPGRDGISPTGKPMRSFMRTTKNPVLARRFVSVAEVLNCYRQVDPRQPFRTDGRPNCPLTYFSISVERVGQAIEVN